MMNLCQILCQAAAGHVLEMVVTGMIIQIKFSKVPGDMGGRWVLAIHGQQFLAVAETYRNAFDGVTEDNYTRLNRRQSKYGPSFANKSCLKANKQEILPLC